MENNFITYYESEEDIVPRNRRKLQIPVKCTTPRRGPLQLQTPNSPYMEVERHSVCQSLPPLPLATRRQNATRRGNVQQGRMLTRFPIVWIQRPIEAIEEKLVGLSCADLQENIQNLSLKPGIYLPQLRQHTHYIQPQSDKGLETVIHNHSTGLMDISITFTRQSNYSISDDHTPLVSDNQFKTQPLSQVMTTQGSAVRSQRLSQYHPIAPPSLNALLIHQRQPITHNTYITGQKYN